MDAFAQVLIDDIPRQEIRGIYLTGSAKKQWDSPIDYVPEISDVDIHIHFYEDSSEGRHFGTVSQALGIQRKVESAYRSRVREPLHSPRPQLIVLNKMMRELNFVFSPRRTVRVLYGEDYPAGDYSDPIRIRHDECNRLIEDEAYLARFPLQVVDKPARYLWESVRTLVWRVSPIGPRVLHISGVGTEEAWSLNRTKVVPMLGEVGQQGLAEPYTAFYLSAWEYFLSRYEDTDAGRAVITSGVKALTQAAEIARSWLGRYPAKPAS